MQNTNVAYDSKVEGEIIVTQADAVINWIRKHSVWPMPMGLACCAIELMAEPKWVVAMGACASTGGMYRSYATLQGVDRIIPVDVYVSGCPPRPEALLDAMIKLQDKIGRESSVKNLTARNTKPAEADNLALVGAGKDS
jgi:NADH-quinone oxidoreductase subunit B